ncbi:MAG: IPT/TIG domain-containing protein, partial [Solirubrobacteraceae bacterium]
MPLRASKNTFAYELVSRAPLRRKVMAGQYVPADWRGDEAMTQPVDGAVYEEVYYSPVYGVRSALGFHRFAVEAGAPGPGSPVLSGHAPPSGPASGGTQTAIVGESLAYPTEVRYGGTPATIRVATPTRIDCSTPPHAPGVVDVTVSNVDGSDTLPGVFSYEDDGTGGGPPPGNLGLITDTQPDHASLG